MTKLSYDLKLFVRQLAEQLTVNDLSVFLPEVAVQILSKYRHFGRKNWEFLFSVGE